MLLPPCKGRLASVASFTILHWGQNFNSANACPRVIEKSEIKEEAARRANAAHSPVLLLLLFKKLYCDNLFKISGAFERTKLQYFDVSHCQSHPYSSGFYRKIEQKPAGQDLSILLRQGLKQTLYPMCWYAAARSWLFFTRAFPASL